MTDPVSLLQDLLRRASVTPDAGDVLAFLEELLTKHGFTCHRLKFSEAGTPDVENLYARLGTTAPHLCFAGHVDVVPTGDVAQWSFDPFGGELREGYICGRGSADMKGAIAAFLAATFDFLAAETPRQGSVSFLITGDEEGPAINGTRKVLEWLDSRGEKIDFCLVGEPTSRKALGDMMKIGRRGTLTGYLTVKGTQGHVAYPHLADNPVPKLLKLLTTLDNLPLDAGTAHFEPSNLEIVNIHIGNPAENVIPAEAKAVFNVRFNDNYSGATLEKKLRATLDDCGMPYDLRVRIGGESFYTPPGKYSALIETAVKSVTGRMPEASTSGGTSDARFIRNYCPVIEFGIVGETMHKTDERVLVTDLHALTRIYAEVLERWFSAA